MTCEECLAEIESGSLRDLPADSPVMLHCARCPDCARVTTLLREREYNAATLLNTLPPLSNPLSVAEAAVRMSHRRRVGRVVVMLSGAALVATIWITAATLIIPMFDDDTPGPQSTLRTETIALSCLSAEQAGDIIEPYIRTHRSAYYAPRSGISAITVRGSAEELAKARELIREFESDPAAACRVPAGTTVPFRYTPGDDRPATSGPPRKDGPTGSPADKVPPPANN
jgi:hypothetical protein